MGRNILIDVIKKYKFNIFLIVMLYCTIIYASIKVPYILGQVIGRLESGLIDAQYILSNFFSVVFFYAIWNLSSYISEVRYHKLNKNIENDLRLYCYGRLIMADYSNHLNSSDGEIIQKIINDTSKVEKSFSNIFDLAISFVHSAAIILIMLSLNIKLTLIVLLFFIAIIVVQKVTSKPLKNLYLKQKKSEEDFLIELKSILKGIFTIKLFNLEEKSISLLNRKNDQNIDNSILIEKKSSQIRNFNFFISSLFRISTIFIGALLYLNDEINIGVIFSMYTYSIQLASQLRKIIETDIIVKGILVSYKRVMEFSNSFTDSRLKPLDVGRITGIEFENVCFSYNDKVIIDKLSFTAKRNDVIGIKGSNGKGKTTLAYLICGILRAEGIYYNGLENDRFSEESILNNVSYVQQDIHLFPVSIKDNISCFGRYCREEVENICKLLGIHSKIANLSDGYDTVINEKTSNLSGGEKQLISIARGLIRDSDVLILDEINSNLDKNAEKTIFKNIKSSFKDKIVFIISHDESVYGICDYVIDLNEMGCI